ncbi:MAG: Flp pilus assembly protein CpaB [Alphaproteobacteria bacterium]|nr:MAG: Flp pilus assembly protein CpaB [Alphaproteobacteria bacterium]
MNINIRSVVLIGIALVIAGVTALLARNLVSTPQGTVGEQVVVKVVDSKMKILVAAIDMPVGHFIKAEDLVWQSWPDETVHERYIQQESDITMESLTGAVAVNTISAGEPILDNRLVMPGNRGFMAAVLPAGKRAISIRITPTSGNAGFVFPGDRVDILLTHEIEIESEGRDKARLSETILRDVRVLAINQSTDNTTHVPSIGKTATLEVTPKEAEKISLIRSMGELTLVLRSLGQPEDENSGQATASLQTSTWDSDVSLQLSGSRGSGKSMSVNVFRGGMKKAQSNTIDFNQLMNQALKSGQNDDSGEDSEEADQ